MAIIVPQRKKGVEKTQGVNPIQDSHGTTWYDNSVNHVKVHDNSQWKKFSSLVQMGENYGYCMGGYNCSSSLTTIDRIEFPFDSGTASHVGNLLEIFERMPAGCNSSNYGYCMGGFNGNYFSTINRITFPFNSGTATHVGNLSRINE